MNQTIRVRIAQVLLLVAFLALAEAAKGSPRRAGERNCNDSSTPQWNPNEKDAGDKHSSYLVGSFPQRIIRWVMNGVIGIIFLPSTVASGVGLGSLQASALLGGPAWKWKAGSGLLTLAFAAVPMCCTFQCLPFGGCPMWLAWSIGATYTVTAFYAAYGVKSVVNSPSSFVTNYANNKWRYPVLTLSTKLYGLAAGYDANKELTLVMQGIDLAKKLARVKLNMSKGEDKDLGELRKMKKATEEKLNATAKEVYERLMTGNKEQSISKGNSFLVAAMRHVFWVASKVSKFLPYGIVWEAEDLDRFLPLLKEATVKSALVTLASAAIYAEGEMSQEEISESMMSTGGHFTAFMGRCRSIKQQEKSKNQRAKLQKMRKTQAPVIVTSNTQAEKIAIEDLPSRETSKARSSTNMMVFILFLVVVAALFYLMYYLAVRIGNPAASEYPKQLVHRDTKLPGPGPISSFIDLELGMEPHTLSEAVDAVLATKPVDTVEVVPKPVDGVQVAAKPVDATMPVAGSPKSDSSSKRVSSRKIVKLASGGPDDTVLGEGAQGGRAVQTRVNNPPPKNAPQDHALTRFKRSTSVRAGRTANNGK